MKIISRDWATPITIGAFAVMSVTGLLMFFHLDIGLNKLAHEWLGWLMVAGVAAHAIANWGAFKRYFVSTIWAAVSSASASSHSPARSSRCLGVGRGRRHRSWR